MAEPTAQGEALRPPADSVPRRFAITLVVNFVKMALGVLAASIVPRALGPRDYGSFQFLTATATTLRTFLDFGASNAAYTYNAKQRGSGLAALLYARWLLLQIGVILLLVFLADRAGLAPRIWPEQRILWVYLITGLEWLTFVGTFLLQLGDAKAETVRVQKINLVTQLLRVGLLVLLYVLGLLGLGTFVLASGVAAAFTVVGVLLGFVLRTRHQHFRLDSTAEERRQCIQFFVSYGRPLAWMSLAIFAHDFFDRWLLQTASGSVQQGYFALGAQWSAIALLFTTSALNIVWREMSLASSSNDVVRMQAIFRKTTRPFFLMSCFIAFIVAFNAGAFVHGLAGAQYASAQPVMVLLAFYPVHQTLGQINGVFFFATERVALYRNLTIGALAGGLMISYLLLAPTTAPVPGLQLGAMGLALKQVGVNILSVNLLQFFNARFVRVRPLREIGYQVGAAAVVGGCAAVAFLAAGHVGVQNAWIRMAGMGALQAVLVGLIIYQRPGLAGVTRQELRGYVGRLRGGIRWG